MQSLPKIVRARLRTAALLTAESHPDADLLTAFAEQSLAGRERDHVVEHLARCGDCREAVLLALPPEVELQPLAASAPQTSATKISATKISANWFRWPVLRWVALAAGVSIVASIATVQYRRQQGRELASNAIQEKPAAPAPLQSPEPSSQALGRQAWIQKDTAGKPAMPQGAISHRPAGSAGGVAGGVGGGIAVSAPPPAAQVPAERDAESASAPADQLEAVGKAKPALVQVFPSTPGPASSLYADSGLKKSPAAPRWTISAGGTLQRSLDGGQTWLDVDIAADQSMADQSMSVNLPRRAKTQMTAAANAEAHTALTSQPQSDSQSEPASESAAEPKAEIKSQARLAAPANVKSMNKQLAAPTIFRAVSVSSDAEVWAGGSGGALYHTLDSGSHWARVLPSATGIVLTGDIISIQFSDGQNGTVTTSSAEVWSTLDDGQTWRKQQ
jgi:hypothetical protein